MSKHYSPTHSHVHLSAFFVVCGYACIRKIQKLLIIDLSRIEFYNQLLKFLRDGRRDRERGHVERN